MAGADRVSKLDGLIFCLSAVSLSRRPLHIWRRWPHSLWWSHSWRWWHASTSGLIWLGWSEIRWPSHRRRRSTHGCRTSHGRWHTWSAHTHTSTRPSKTWWRLIHHRGDLLCSAHWLSSTHAAHSRTFSNAASRLSWWCFSTHCDYAISSK